MSDCSNHKKEVAGISDMKLLAEMIGDLRYDTLEELLDKLADKLLLDAAKDRAAGRNKLADELHSASANVMFASIDIGLCLLG